MPLDRSVALMAERIISFAKSDQCLQFLQDLITRMRTTKIFQNVVHRKSSFAVVIPQNFEYQILQVRRFNWCDIGSSHMLIECAVCTKEVVIGMQV